jgi:hypothetical protein
MKNVFHGFVLNAAMALFVLAIIPDSSFAKQATVFIRVHVFINNSPVTAEISLYRNDPYSTPGEDVSNNHVTGFEERVTGSGLYSDTYAYAALPLQRGKQYRVIISVPALQYEKEFLRTVAAGDTIKLDDMRFETATLSLNVLQNNRPTGWQIKILDMNGKIIVNGGRHFNGWSRFSVPAGAHIVCIYHDGGKTEISRFECTLAMNEVLKKTIELNPGYQSGSESLWQRLRSDIAAIDANGDGFSFLEYFTLFFALSVLLMPVLFVIAVLISIVEHKNEIGRSLKGSWVTFICGCLICIYMLYGHGFSEFEFSLEYLGANLAMFSFLLAIPSFFIACRQRDARMFDSLSLISDSVIVGALASICAALSYSYYVNKATGHTFRVTSGGGMLTGGFFVIIIGFFLGFFMPIYVSYKFIRNYIMPLLSDALLFLLKSVLVKPAT